MANTPMANTRLLLPYRHVIVSIDKFARRTRRIPWLVTVFIDKSEQQPIDDFIDSLLPLKSLSYQRSRRRLRDGERNWVSEVMSRRISETLNPSVPFFRRRFADTA
ncbi:hypothetical protein L1987_70402 [Smallanthus sonchifolius]|uniref:Uncharacterized protein n=1 Tax=Smallanthus sonchifolius TaxID=185202 RepID=A0ACB9APU2_9ASTR|nr:hypothetical protein L1987_70402 [Smallanthus sonchifolius]